MTRAAVTLVLLLTPAAWCGEIVTQLKPGEPVLEAWAIRRTRTDEGIRFDRYRGRVDGDTLSVADLPVPGSYDLKIRMKSGWLEGWNATVPASDYVEEQPLSAAARRTILQKMTADSFTAYWDRVVILDIRGNIQNAVVLRAVLRTRPFVGGNPRPGEWVWRVERWRWEDPLEHTWTTHQEEPYYALVRRRLFPKEHRALRTNYARHLGGIALTQQRPKVDLGLTRLPRPVPETCAIRRDGSRIDTIVLKPASSTGVELQHEADPGGAE